MYEDQHPAARPGRPAQGQRCAACGNLDPDPLARFCGICGGAMGTAIQPVGAPPGPPAPFPARGFEQPVRHTPAGPPAQVYAAAPGPFGSPQPPARMVYTVPAVNLVGATQIGAAISAAFSLIPCLLFAGIVSKILSDSRWVLDSWTNASFRVPVPIVAVDVPVNYIDLFRLRSLHNFLIYWDDRIWLLFVLLFVIPWIFSIISGALFGVSLAAIYNAVGASTGGMRVTLVPGHAPSPGQPVQQSAWAPGPPPAWPNQGWPPDQRR